MNVLEIYLKNIFSSVHFKKFELSNPPTSNYIGIAWRASVVESLFSKATLSRNLTRAWHVPKRNLEISLLEISRSVLFSGVTGLWYTVSNATEIELLTKFLKGTLKLTENFQKVISNGVPHQKFPDLQFAAFNLACF